MIELYVIGPIYAPMSTDFHTYFLKRSLVAYAISQMSIYNTSTDGVVSPSYKGTKMNFHFKNSGKIHFSSLRESLDGFLQIFSFELKLNYYN